MIFLHAIRYHLHTFPCGPWPWRMVLQMPKEAPCLSKDHLLRACWPGGKRCALSLLCDTERRQARGRWREECWVEGQGAQQWPLSSREGPSVKCVFLQFEKVESGQIGVLLSSDCMSYVTEGGGWGEAGAVHEGAGTALIDTFNSSERGVKSWVVLNSGIPGQTGCLHGDGRGGGRAPPFVEEIGGWKWIRSDRSAPWAT